MIILAIGARCDEAIKFRIVKTTRMVRRLGLGRLGE
jgi:hypothetical protein